MNEGKIPQGVFASLQKKEPDIQETRKQYTENGIHSDSKETGKKVTFYLSKSLIRRLKIAAANEDKKLSELVSESIEEMLKKREK